jgi:UDP-N-acetylmuramate dehydrogenase
VRAESEGELIASVTLADEADEPVLILGGGSNLVVADAGVPGLTVHVATRGLEEDTAEDGRVRLSAAAGVSWDVLVEYCVNSELSGLEALSWIPGTVGAAPIQNVGAYDQTVKQRIESIRAYDRRKRDTVVLAGVECGFAYRNSVFKADPNRYVVLEVTFLLERSPDSQPIEREELCKALQIEPGETVPLARVREAIHEIRHGRGMVLDADDPDTWSVGSVFKNPLLSPDDFGRLCDRGRDLGKQVEAELEAGMFKPAAAWLIEHSDFPKGYPLKRDPEAPVAVSNKHALALTNRGSGTTAELLDLAVEIADGVDDVFGVRLEPEPSFAGLDWSLEADARISLRDRGA